MSESILVAIISGAISLIGIVASYKAATNKVTQTMEVQQAIMRTEMSDMKEDIKSHNNLSLIHI